MTNQTPALGAMPPAGLNELRRHWGWLVGVGIVLMVLGAIAVVYAAATTMLSVLGLGWLLIVGGIIEGVHAFGEKQWGSFFIDLFAAALYVVLGFLLVANPGTSAAGLTLLIAMFLILSGIFRIAAGLGVRAPHWGWVLAHGVVSLVLGILIWQQWPVSGLWAIGLFVGIEVLANGITLLALGLTVRRLPAEPGAA